MPQHVVTYPGCDGLCDGVFEFNLTLEERNRLHMYMKWIDGIYDSEDAKLCGSNSTKTEKKKRITSSFSTMGINPRQKTRRNIKVFDNTFNTFHYGRRGKGWDVY